jgi:hypothetical protein
MGDRRREQREIVVVLARPHADAALPLGVRQLGISEGVLLDAVLGGIDHAPALGQADPVAFGIAVFGGDVGVHLGVVQRLGDALLLGVGEARDVDGQDHVGGRVRAFGEDAVLQPLVEEEHLGLDAGLGREGIEHGLDEVGLAIGIDVDGFLGHGPGRGQEKREAGRAKTGEIHETAPFARGGRKPFSSRPPAEPLMEKLRAAVKL